jgi:predicted nuclease of restriction endonuclease-like (RecB) superfamily
MVYLIYCTNIAKINFTKLLPFSINTIMNTELQLPNDYTITLELIKTKISEARFKSLVLVNTVQIKTYLDIGKIILGKTKGGWGESVIDKMSVDSQAEYAGAKGFSPRNLRRMRLIYDKTKDSEIWTQAVSKIPWGQSNVIFSKLSNKDQIDFYLDRCVVKGWSRGILEEEIKFDAFSKRLLQNNFEKTLSTEQLHENRLEHRDEYDLSFLELDPNHSERRLEDSMFKNLSKVLKKFGKDFCFMGRQYRLELDYKEYFIDLLFYHRKLKSLIAIELKSTEFKYEHAQQLNWYLHLLDKSEKYEGDNPSIGILLCQNKSKITVEYALELVNHPIGVATYTYNQLPKEVAELLPSEKDLIESLNKEIKDNEK